MTLLLGPGPLAADPVGDRNFRVDGPAHRLYLHPHPRRMRAVVAGRTIFDTTGGALLHETNILPRLYVPLADLDPEVLEPSDTTTRCPFKGEASYWSLRVGDRLVEDAVWSYPEPIADAPWLAGLASVYLEKLDAILEEDEELPGHLRDPYHRVDARRTSRRVDVRAGGDPVASSDRAVLVFETGLPPRAYLPREDVRAELVPSETRAVCPYKGHASYWSLRLDDRTVEDAGWSYEAPFDGVQAIRGHMSFLHDDLEVRIAEPAGDPAGAPA